MKKQHLACMGLLCAILWSACSGKRYHSEVSSADTVAINNTDTSQAAKLVKTADMHFKVKNVTKASEDISALTIKFGGMVMHHNMQSDLNRSIDVPLNVDSVMRVSSYANRATIAVKLPSAQIEEFMNTVGKMAVYINNRNMDIQDRTLDYLAAQMKLVSRTELINQQKKGIVKIKNPAAVMNLKDDLIDEQIDNKRIDAAVKYSTIVLDFYQSNTVLKEVIVNDDPSNFKLPYSTRLAQALANGSVVFLDCLVGLTNLWLFILTAVAGWLIYRYVKRKQIINLG